MVAKPLPHMPLNWHMWEGLIKFSAEHSNSCPGRSSTSAIMHCPSFNVILTLDGKNYGAVHICVTNVLTLNSDSFWVAFCHYFKLDFAFFCVYLVLVVSVINNNGCWSYKWSFRNEDKLYSSDEDSDNQRGSGNLRCYLNPSDFQWCKITHELERFEFSKETHMLVLMLDVIP